MIMRLALHAARGRALMILAAIVLLTFGSTLPLSPVRFALTIPAAFLAPGYGVLAVVFGRSIPRDVPLLVAASVAISIAIDALGGTVLGALGRHLDTTTFVSALDLLLAVLATIYLWRAGSLSVAAVRPEGVADSGDTRRSFWNTPFALAVPLGALGIGVGLVAALLYVLPAAPSTPYSAVALGGAWARLATIPAPAPGDDLTVPIIITNHTGKQRRYVVQPYLDYLPSWPSRSIVIASDDQWSGTIAGPVSTYGCAHRLGIALSVDGQRQAFLTIWVRGTAGSSVCTSAR